MEPFRVAEPTVAPLPIVASVPHSGTRVPEAIAARLRPECRCLPDTDWHVDALFDFLPSLGVTVLAATHNRYVVDLNRSLDALRFGPIADALVAAESFDGRAVYDEAPSERDLDERIERWYLPYHRKLAALLDDAVARFGRAYLLDLHAFDDVPVADVVLGDDDGRLAAGDLTGLLRRHLGGPFDVLENEVWTGGHLVLRHGARPGVQAVQVETRHGLYLEPDEIARATSPGLGRVAPPRRHEPRFGRARAGLERAFRALVADPTVRGGGSGGA